MSISFTSSDLREIADKLDAIHEINAADDHACAFQVTELLITGSQGEDASFLVHFESGNGGAPRTSLLVEGVA